MIGAILDRSYIIKVRYYKKNQIFLFLRNLLGIVLLEQALTAFERSLNYESGRMTGAILVKSYIIEASY